MRIDKFLKISRILKRRSVAADAAKGGRVFVGGKEVKPSYNVKIGDVVEIHFGNGTFKFIVKDIKEHLRKEETESLYQIIE